MNQTPSGTTSDRKSDSTDASEHTATTEASSATWTVMRGEVVVARSDRVIMVIEQVPGHELAPVPYFPADSIDPALLTDTDHQTFCPVKGTAKYHTVTVGSETLDNSVWFYPGPTDNVAAIAGHLGFYPDRFTITVDPD